jgi:hypothetical protein
MGPRIPPAERELKGIVKVMWMSAGLVTAALALGICDLALHARRSGAEEVTAAAVPPLTAVGLLLGAAGCAALCCSARHLVNRLKRGASASQGAQDAHGCRWYSRQRHAFGNHMQIVSSLLALKRFDDAREYIAQIAESLKTDDAAQFDESCPELDDALCRRIETARSRGVDVVVLRWDPCHRLEMSLVEACTIIGLTLDLAIECAASRAGASRVYVSNCTGCGLYGFLVEWGPAEPWGERTEMEIAAAHIAAEAAARERTWRGPRADDVAFLAEKVAAAGGAFTFGGDSRRGFVEFSLPAINAGDQE